MAWAVNHKQFDTNTGPRGLVFESQLAKLGHLLLWPWASHISTTPEMKLSEIVQLKVQIKTKKEKVTIDIESPKIEVFF